MVVRFEEEVVERWYIVRGYLTAKNIGFSSPVRMPGGKGRGEIDLLAVRCGKNGIEDRVRCEVSVSVTSDFPFISKTEESVDDVYKLVKKFFSKGADLKAREYLGSSEYRCQLITSKFKRNCIELFEENLLRFNAKLVDSEFSEEKAKIKVEYNPSDPNSKIELSGMREIELIPFPTVLKELREKFEERGLMKKDFSDIIMRSLQYLARFY